MNLMEKKQANTDKTKKRGWFGRWVEKLETQIHAMEDNLKALNDDISAASAAGDMDRITTLGADYATQDAQLQSTYAEWEQLSAELENG